MSDQQIIQNVKHAREVQMGLLLMKKIVCDIDWLNPQVQHTVIDLESGKVSNMIQSWE